MGVAIGGSHDFVGNEFAFAVTFGEFASHQAFDGEDGVLGVGDGLTLGGLSDEAFAVFGESHDGGGGTVAFRVGNDLVFTVIHDSHAAVGRAEVDTENFAHNMFPFCFF